MKRKTKACVGCGDNFLTFKNYDYCPECAINGNRYSYNSPCSECDGSGVIKFPRQKPRPCKLCYLTNMKKTKKLTAEEQEEQF
jgi:DnaJ-class molecular chaperone